MTATSPIGVLHIRQSSGGGGGADTVLRQVLCKANGNAGMRMVVAYLHKPQHDVAALAGPLREAGVAVHELPGGAWWDGDQVRALSSLIADEDIHIVHTHDVKSDVLAWLLRRRHPGLRIVATIHGWTSRSFKGRLYEVLDRWALRRFDGVIAVSMATRDRAARGGIRHAAVIPNAIDTDRWRSPDRPHREPASPFTVGFIGRLSAEKNPAGVVAVAERTPDMRFRIAGEGPERERVDALIREKGLEDRVHLVGQLSPDDLPAFYGGLDAVLSTSRTEGLPMNLLEAGAMALPVVATAVGGVPEVIVDGETGHLASFGDWDRLAADLAKLQAEPEEACEMGLRARTQVEEHFSLIGAVGRTEEFYRGLL